jgi:hypothetical protein
MPSGPRRLCWLRCLSQSCLPATGAALGQAGAAMMAAAAAADLRRAGRRHAVKINHLPTSAKMKLNYIKLNKIKLDKLKLTHAKMERTEPRSMKSFEIRSRKLPQHASLPALPPLAQQSPPSPLPLCCLRCRGHGWRGGGRGGGGPATSGANDVSQRDHRLNLPHYFVML